MRDVVPVVVVSTSSAFSTGGSTRFAIQTPRDTAVETVEQLRDLAHTAVDLRNAAIKLRFDVMDLTTTLYAPRYGYEVRAVWRAPDRETGIMIDLYAGWHFAPIAVAGPRRRSEWIALLYLVAEEVYKHELSEAFHVDGVRANDRHAHDRDYTPWRAGLSQIQIY